MTSLLAASQFHCSTFAIYLFFSVRKRIFRFVPNGLVPRHHIIDSSEFSGISTFYAFGSWKEIGLSKAGSFTDSHRAIVSHAALVDLSSVWEKFLWGLRLRGLNVAEDMQPTVKEQVEVYRQSRGHVHVFSGILISIFSRATDQDSGFEEHSSINHIVATTKFENVFLRFSLQWPPNLHFLIKKSFSCM